MDKTDVTPIYKDLALVTIELLDQQWPRKEELVVASSENIEHVTEGFHFAPSFKPGLTVTHGCMAGVPG